MMESLKHKTRHPKGLRGVSQGAPIVIFYLWVDDKGPRIFRYKFLLANEIMVPSECEQKQNMSLLLQLGTGKRELSEVPVVKEVREDIMDTSQGAFPGAWRSRAGRGGDLCEDHGHSPGAPVSACREADR